MSYNQCSICGGVIGTVSGNKRQCKTCGTVYAWVAGKENKEYSDEDKLSACIAISFAITDLNDTVREVTAGTKPAEEYVTALLKLHALISIKIKQLGIQEMSESQLKELLKSK